MQRAYGPRRVYSSCGIKSGVLSCSASARASTPAKAKSTLTVGDSYVQVNTPPLVEGSWNAYGDPAGQVVRSLPRSEERGWETAAVIVGWIGTIASVLGPAGWVAGTGASLFAARIDCDYHPGGGACQADALGALTGGIGAL